MEADVRYEFLDRQQQLVDFCQDIAAAPAIAFDTEFISEDSYRPQLCLLQVAAAGRLAIVDPLAMDDVDAFWQLLAAGQHATVVHAGREEFRFCLSAIGQRPHGWFDVQLASGFLGLEFPAAYSTLIAKLLNKSLPKGETRTDWRRRPLSKRQLDYAVQDVMYLAPMRDILAAELERLGRTAWFAEETEQWQRQMEDGEKQQNWRRTSGISGLSRRSLAIVRDLWKWRDAEAQRRDCPPRRVLRDDLIVELARRKTAELRRIRAVRGLERAKRHHAALASCIQQALDLPDAECPASMPRANSKSSQFNLLGQFLNAALGTICRSAQLAPTLVGTVQDVRELIAHHLGVEAPAQGTLPLLTEGWRAEVVGRVLEDVLRGKLALRVEDALAEQPLSFEPVSADAAAATGTGQPARSP